jgi:hypothetical protein
MVSCHKLSTTRRLSQPILADHVQAADHPRSEGARRTPSSAIQDRTPELDRFCSIARVRLARINPDPLKGLLLC